MYRERSLRPSCMEALNEPPVFRAYDDMSLHLDHLGSAFFLYCALIFCAILVFIGEITYAYKVYFIDEVGLYVPIDDLSTSQFREYDVVTTTDQSMDTEARHCRYAVLMHSFTTLHGIFIVFFSMKTLSFERFERDFRQKTVQNSSNRNLKHHRSRSDESYPAITHIHQ